MEDALKNIISDYLARQDTDFALMITGEWGKGKTYFVKNELKEFIESTPLPNQEEENKEEAKETYKQIYVSLYGVSSIEDIKNRIFYSIHPNFKWGGIITDKLVGLIGLIPTVGKAAKELVTLNDEEIEDLRNRFTSYNDKIFFFDDLERVDSRKIDIKSVLGYINSLSEHNHCKIVVVANEEEIEPKVDFQKFKEKTVRFTYKYNPDMSKVFDSICERYNKTDEETYKAFLEKHKDFILSIFKAGKCENLRTLIFATDVFQKIFIKSDQEEVMIINKELLLSITIMSIETKKRQNIDQLKKTLQPNDFLSYLDLSGSEDDYKDVQKHSREDNFFVKYKEVIQDFNIQPYDELITLIYDGFLPSSWSKTLQTISQEIYSKLTTHKLFNQIINWTLIPEQEFHTVIKNLIQCISFNQYKAGDLLRIYCALVQIDEYKLDGFKLTEDLNALFKNAINKAMDGLPFCQNLYYQLPKYESDNTQSVITYNELKIYIAKLNLLNKKEANTKIQNNVLDMIKNNKADELKDYISKLDHKTFLQAIDAKEMVKCVTEANSETKLAFRLSIIAVFPDNNSNPSNEDGESLQNLKAALDDYLSKQTTKKVSFVHLFRAQQYLDKIIPIYTNK